MNPVLADCKTTVAYLGLDCDVERLWDVYRHVYHSSGEHLCRETDYALERVNETLEAMLGFYGGPRR